jgi:type IV secretory pathway VirB2 component (pilin)
MKKSPPIFVRRGPSAATCVIAIAFAALLLTTGVEAQSPWERAATTFANSMTGTIARAACVICAVLAGIGLSTGEPGAARRVAYLCAGISLAIGAANFVTWIGG